MISRYMVLALKIAWQIWRKFLKDVERLILCSIGRSVISLLLLGCPCDIVPLNMGMTSFEVIVVVVASTFLLIFVLIVLS